MLILGIILTSCKTPIPPHIEIPPTPPELLFTGMRADNPMELYLDFLLDVDIPGFNLEMVELESWQVLMKGREASSAFNLAIEENSVFLKMDIARLIALDLAPEEQYNVNLILLLSHEAYPDTVEVSGHADFPGVLAPDFTILNIAILQAELVNTRFRVGMRIDNPNPFPVELSAFSYELYGNGRFWAEGMERNLIQIPGKAAVEGHLFMMMNFIDMDRNLLDQIINLENVNYRFAGEAQVSTGIEYLPTFHTEFNLSGYSRVYGD